MSDSPLADRIAKEIADADEMWFGERWCEAVVARVAYQVANHVAPLEAEVSRLRQLGLELLEEWHEERTETALEHNARPEQWAAHMDEYQRHKAEWEKQP